MPLQALIGTEENNSGLSGANPASVTREYREQGVNQPVNLAFPSFFCRGGLVNTIWVNKTRRRTYASRCVGDSVRRVEARLSDYKGHNDSYHT